MNQIPYIIQGDNIVLVVNNKPHTINKTHVSYDEIKEAIITQDWDVIPNLVDVKQAITEFTNGVFTITGDQFYFQGEEVHGVLADRIVDMYKDGFDIKPMLNFVMNLNHNPSARSVNELYGFLEKSNLPITPDGCFLAYKKVRDDYLDVHSATVLNKPAKLIGTEIFEPYTTDDVNKVKVDIIDGVTTISMPRNKVNDDKEETCSYGLHFCSYDYLKHFPGDRIVLLKINPKDVVSIPADYSDTKGRTCAYQVIDELEMTIEEDHFDKSVYDDAEDLYWDTSEYYE